MAPMTGGQAVAAALAAHGVDTTFGIPGTHNLPIFGAMGQCGIRNIVTRHEQGAGFAADGFARSSGRPGVVITTGGATALNALAAAAQAFSDSVPVLYISPSLSLRRPALRSGALHEIRDQRAAFGAILDISLEATSVRELPVVIAQCFAKMLAGRPQPAHLSIPFDVLEEVADVRIVSPLSGPVPAHPSVGSLDVAARLISRARAPLIIVGGGAFGATEELLALAAYTGAAVISTQNGKGIFPESHSQFVGNITQGNACVAAVEQADIIIGVATEFAETDWWDRLPPTVGDKLIRIDIDSGMIVSNVIPACPIIGDAASSLRALMNSTVREAKAHISKGWLTALSDLFAREASERGHEWADLLDALRLALPPRTIISADDTSVCYNGVLAGVPIDRPRGYMFPTGALLLGFGVPAAIGAKVANPTEPVVAIAGDGGVMFTVQELATAAQLQLPIPIVIVDNGGYGEIRNIMASRNQAPDSVALGRNDFAGLARALGCIGITVSNTTDLASTISSAFEADRPTVIHYFEKSGTADALHQGL